MHSPEVGDYIGVESCVDLTSDVADVTSHGGGCGTNNRRRRRDAAEKKYPPPITCLARTENQPSHMPWVMKRYYIDGRLVIREEKVKHHEYFRAHRSNGRLVLNLVPLDDAVDEEKSDYPEINEELVSGEEINGGDEEISSDPTVKEAFYKYTGMGVNVCGGFAVAAPAYRPPVHT